MKAAGIDIGTTTVCGIVVDMHTGEVADVCTLANDAAMEGKDFERLQDAERIWELTREIYRGFLQKFADICCVGLTGQMHGIVYTDEHGMAVSPLYTWQDERGSQQLEDGVTYVQRLSETGGCQMASGYGLTTHFYQTVTGQIPEGAVHFCAIHDYIGMRLTDRKEPLVTPSTAASFGCFDLQRGCFDTEAIRRAGMEESYLPQCEDGCVLLGETPEGILVSAGIGDNQASVLGSVRDVRHSILVNVGTGAQVSVGTEHLVGTQSTEQRPMIGIPYLLAGSSLCGGRAYAALEKFLRSTVTLMTGQDSGELYGRMDEVLTAYEKSGKKGSLKVRTSFCGTRREPALTGSIDGLTLSNFAPEELIYGVLEGMAMELVSFYEEMRRLGADEPKYLIGSGNGIRRNRHLQKIFEDIFKMKMQIPKHREEAAYGASLYAMTASGGYKTIGEAQELIQYL